MRRLAFLFVVLCATLSFAQDTFRPYVWSVMPDGHSVKDQTSPDEQDVPAAPSSDPNAKPQSVHQRGETFYVRLDNFKQKDVTSISTALIADCNDEYELGSSGSRREGKFYYVEFYVPPDAPVCDYKLDDITYSISTEGKEPKLEIVTQYENNRETSYVRNTEDNTDWTHTETLDITVRIVQQKGNTLATARVQVPTRTPH